MLEILRNHFFEIMTTLIGLITIFIIISQRRKKVLSYKIMTNSPLISVNDEIAGNLQILLDGDIVKNVYLIVIKIFNSGNIPIKSADYEYPLNLNFGENAKLLTAEVIETKPHDMKISTSIEGTRVLLTPTLMNEMDSITIKILADQFNGQIGVEGRIIGIKKIKESVDGKYRFNDAVFLLFSAIIGLFVGFSTRLMQDVFELEKLVAVITFTVMMIVVIFLISYRNRYF